MPSRGCFYQLMEAWCAIIGIHDFQHLKYPIVDSYLQKSYRMVSKTRMGPVRLMMVRGWPEKSP